MAPNILLVVLDALRRDAIEPYGAPPGATPTIAQLADSGEALPLAYATASWTLPSHASMFSGLLPRQLGLTQAPGGSPGGARPVLEGIADRLLAQVLRRSGYRTVGLSTNLWASQHVGLDAGFDSFTYATDRGGRTNALLGTGPRAHLAWSLEGLRARSDDGARHVGRLLRAEIENWSGQPAFWFVNLCECHSPYLPPRPFNDLSAAERVRAAFDARRHLSFDSICLYAAGRWEIPDEAMQRMRHLYARAASYMDSWLAQVLEALERRGILQDTLVIVTSDHGENFGEGGLIAHGFSVDERLIHVPLVLSGPGTVPVKRPFTLAELPRLIADAAGLTDHPWRQRELPEGIAIAQYDPMGTADDPRVREFARRFDLDEPAIERVTAAFTSASDGRHKLVIRDGHELLFDLTSDPGEEAPLAAGAANGAYPALRRALEHPAVLGGAAPGATVTGPGRVGTPGASAEELAQLEQQMRLLGYM